MQFSLLFAKENAWCPSRTRTERRKNQHGRWETSAEPHTAALQRFPAVCSARQRAAMRTPRLASCPPGASSRPEVRLEAPLSLWLVKSTRARRMNDRPPVPTALFTAPRPGPKTCGPSARPGKEQSDAHFTSLFLQKHLGLHQGEHTDTLYCGIIFF